MLLALINSMIDKVMILIVIHLPVTCRPFTRKVAGLGFARGPGEEKTSKTGQLRALSPRPSNKNTKNSVFLRLERCARGKKGQKNPVFVACSEKRSLHSPRRAKRSQFSGAAAGKMAQIPGFLETTSEKARKLRHFWCFRGHFSRFCLPKTSFFAFFRKSAAAPGFWRGFCQKLPFRLRPVTFFPFCSLFTAFSRSGKKKRHFSLGFGEARGENPVFCARFGLRLAETTTLVLV